MLSLILFRGIKYKEYRPISVSVKPHCREPDFDSCNGECILRIFLIQESKVSGSIQQKERTTGQTRTFHLKFDPVEMDNYRV